jgi:beta-N-acetylhexosaminidase
VQRFRSDGFTAPAADARAGRAVDADALAATDAATAAGHVLGAELRACGVDLSFTPVLDLDHGASSVIGDRAFHRDPRVVTLLAKSLMHGLLRPAWPTAASTSPGTASSADSHPRCRSTGAA